MHQFRFVFVFVFVWNVKRSNNPLCFRSNLSSIQISMDKENLKFFYVFPRYCHFHTFPISFLSQTFVTIKHIPYCHYIHLLIIINSSTLRIVYEMCLLTIDCYLLISVQFVQYYLTMQLNIHVLTEKDLFWCHKNFISSIV